MHNACSLDGEWQFLPLKNEDSCADALPAANAFEAEPILVPGCWNTFPNEIGGDWGAYDSYGYPAAWQKASAAWYRRTFRMDGVHPAGTTLHLRFDAVLGTATVYLNRQQVGTNHDSFLPFSFDATSAVKPDADNELLVRVDPPPKKDGLWLQPCGSWFGWYMRGIWQSVHLESRPPQAITDIFAAPSVRNQSLTVEVTVAASVVVENAELRIRVEDAGKQALDLGAAPVRMDQPGELQTSVTRNWPDAHLWSPDDPHLYHAVAELLVGGQVVHTANVRFGFREFWIEGTEFRLNGSPIRLFGDSWHYMGPVQQNPAYARTWYTFARDVGVNAIRTHAMPYPPFYFDIADEMGMMIIDESAIYGSAGTLAFDEPVFWDNCREHIRSLVRRDRNHPSIIFWSASNETVWKGGEAVYEPLAALADEAKQLDPTRFVSFDENDSDLGGRSPVHSGHYGTPEHWDRAWKRDKPLIIHEFSALYHGGPEAASPIGGDEVYAYFDKRLQATGEDAAEMFLKLRAMGAASITPWNLNWYCLTPIPEKAIESVPPEVTAGGAPLRRIGERSVTLKFWEFSEPKPLLSKEELDDFQICPFFRQHAAIGLWHPNPACEPLAECYLRQRLYVPHIPQYAYSENPGNVDLEVWNDTVQPLNAELRFNLTELREGVVNFIRHVHLGAGQKLNARIAYTLPGFSKVASLQAKLALVSADDGSVLHEMLWILTVSPRPIGKLWRDIGPNASPARGITITAESCAAAASLRSIIGEDASVKVDDGAEFAPNSTLLLTAEDHDRTLMDWLSDKRVGEWLHAGGRLVVLPDAVRNDPQQPLSPQRRGFARLFCSDPRSGGLFRQPGQYGVLQPDLEKFHAQSCDAYMRPITGPAWTPIEVGDPAEGMAHSPLVVVGQGKGHIVLCGLDLLRSSETDPAAALILARVLMARLPFVGSSLSDVIGARAYRDHWIWKDAGLVAHSDADVLIADGADLDVFTDPRIARERMNDFLQSGGVLLVDNIIPQTLEAWNRLLDATCELHYEQVCNVSLHRRDTFPGINNHDLCWVCRDQKQPIVEYSVADYFGQSTAIGVPDTRWDDYQLTAEQCKVAMMQRRIEQVRSARRGPMPNAAVLQIPRGRGRIIINQLLLREARGPFRSRALRIWSRMLDALGVARDEHVSPLAPRERRVVDAEGFITDWLVLGPFAGSGGQPLDHAFLDEASLQPAEGETVEKRCWQRVSSAFPHVTLNDVWPDLPQRDRVAYAAVFVYAPQDRSVLLDAPDMIALRCGADGGTKPFLNGKCVGRFDFVRELVLDSDRVGGLPLRKGWNQLVIKLHNPSGRWCFAARLVTASGEPARDLTVALAPTDDV